MKLMIVGATGLVGSNTLALALDSPEVETVVAPVRRALPDHPKLLSPQVDFESLPRDAEWWQVDAVICALGTTMRKAGSRAAFERVDHDYPLAVAKLAHAAGASGYVLNSAVGANPDSRFFYNQVKGNLECDLREIGFDSLTFVRPGLIGGQREEFRLGERSAELLLKLLHPILPARMRINPAFNIAQAMLKAALSRPSGNQVIDAAALA